jgi:hypothetical protein
VEVEEEAVVAERRGGGGVGAKERERSVNVARLERAAGVADELSRSVGRGRRGVIRRGGGCCSGGG